MSRTFRHGDRHLRVRGIRRPTDLRRLARVLIDLEQARMEAEAEAERDTRRQGREGRRRNDVTGSTPAESDQEDAA